VKKKLSTLIFPLLILMFVSLACGGSISTANIADAWIAADDAGSNPTTTFSQDAPGFYALVDLQNAPDDTVLRAVWIAENVQDVDPGFVIDEAELVNGSNLAHFSLENDQLWPLGQYKVEIYLNGELAETLTFEVR
jgi:hypothetical protein